MRQDATEFMLLFKEYVKEEKIEITEENEFEEMQKFLEIYNKRLHQVKGSSMEISNLEKADNYYDMAAESFDEAYCKRMLRKAIKLNPGFIDAHAKLASYIENNEKRMQEYLHIASMAWEQLEDLKLTDEESKKAFYSIIETRPYMRIKHRIMIEYREMKCIRQAIQIAEELLTLNENDNMGVRYTLIGLYTMLEEKEKAEALYEHYQEDSVPMHLLLGVSYYKLQDIESSSKHFKMVKEIVPNAYRVFGGANLEKDLKENIPGYYSPNTVEEILLFMGENMDLFTEGVLEMIEKTWR